MPFNAQDYFEAAKERVGEARQCYEQRQYVVAHYLAGLAVECLLRAYRVRRDPRFDARHDLNLLRKQASFCDFVAPRRVVEVSSSLSTILARWANDDRYRSETALRRKMKGAGLDRGVKGDFLKENSRVIVDAALAVVTEGVRQWVP
jgi:HEPN domain-containing protein